MKNKGYQLTHMGLATLSSKSFFSAVEFLSHIFGVSRIYAKSRVGSEGVTGLKTRGRPPRLDDTHFVHDVYNYFFCLGVQACYATLCATACS